MYTMGEDLYLDRDSEQEAKEMKKEGETLTLDKVMEEAVVAQAISQGFKFE